MKVTEHNYVLYTENGYVAKSFLTDFSDDDVTELLFSHAGKKVLKRILQKINEHV